MRGLRRGLEPAAVAPITRFHKATHIMIASSAAHPAGVQLPSLDAARAGELLTPEALEFLADLERASRAARQQLLKARRQRQERLDAGETPNFLAETAEIRAADWRIAPLPADLQNRRVEIVGPVDRRSVIESLNSGAKSYIADFEDGHSPTWQGTLTGHANLRDAVNGTIEFRGPRGSFHTLDKQTATLMVRPRGWHLNERNLLVDGTPISASVFDFALYFFHNAQTLIDKGTGPYFCLPKLENHLEARLWNDLFTRAESALGIPHGTIKATVQIDGILAALEMDEILYELRDHAAGLSLSRRDYLFSFVQKFRDRPECLLADRAMLTKALPQLRACAQLLVETCHRRGAHALGDISTQIPIVHDPLANQWALAAVRDDQECEAAEGFDGTRVAHPGLVDVALDVFDSHMFGPHQRSRRYPDLQVKAEDLLAVPTGPITRGGLRINVALAVRYLESWLRGHGSVPLFNQLEDMATAELARAQIWQWLRHPEARLANGARITQKLVREVLEDELDQLRRSLGTLYFQSKFDQAGDLFLEVCTSFEFVEFLSLAAQEELD